LTFFGTIEKSKYICRGKENPNHSIYVYSLLTASKECFPLQKKETRWIMDEILVEQIRCLNQISAWETFGMHAVAVVSKGNPGEYENNPTVIEYQAKGYELVDANMFGQGGETGEILIFNKVEDGDVKRGWGC
jgi:hypothetical protein